MLPVHPDSQTSSEKNLPPMLTPAECIAFRLLYLTWFGSIGILGYAGYAYEMEGSAQGQTLATFEELKRCESMFYSQHDLLCKKSEEACYDAMLSTCRYEQAQFNNNASVRDSWTEIVRTWLNSAGLIFVGSVVLFFGIRWAITGRVRPFLFLPK